MFNWKYLKDEIKLQEYVDNTIIIKITNHHLSRKGRHILYSSDTAYRKPLRYTYICEKLINHDSEVVLNSLWRMLNRVSFMKISHLNVNRST